MTLGHSDYFNGALERLRESSLLLKSGHVSGSIYLGGRAVESILRALIWKYDESFSRGKRILDTGHDLRQMIKLVETLGILQNYALREGLINEVINVSRLWSNNMRFMPASKIQTFWYNL